MILSGNDDSTNDQCKSYSIIHIISPFDVIICILIHCLGTQFRPHYEAKPKTYQPGGGRVFQEEGDAVLQLARMPDVT